MELMPSNCRSEENVTVVPNPTANFSFLPNGLLVDFTDLSTSAVSYFWEFGDGGTSTQTNPSYIYLSPSTYTACLTVTDSNGCQDSTCQSVTTTVSRDEPGLPGVQLSPNPVRDQLRITLPPDLGPVEIELYDLKGRQVQPKRQELVRGNSTLLDTRDLASGLYLIRLRSASGQHQQRFLRE